MFINFWYPTVVSDELTDEPEFVQILGQDLVVFRDSSGAAHCLSNVCVHRGGSLAHGKIKGDCVQCSYHGWQFDGTGQCTRIPTMDPAKKIPQRIRVDSYPVEERYGLVFAFLGDLPESERVPIMDIPEYGTEGWRATIQHWVFDVNYLRSMENGIDPSHNEFVHPTHGFSGERDDYHLKKREPYDTEWGSAIKLGGIAPPLHEEKMREASGREENAWIEGGTGHHGINSIWTHIHPTREVFIHQYLFESPIDEYRTSVFLVNLRNFLIEPENDERMMTRNEVVAFQDRDVLMRLRPLLTPTTKNKEYLVAGDASIAQYRKWVQKWESLGWRIDVEKLRAKQDRVAYAIPCPGRRKQKGWTIDAVPMVKSKPATAASIKRATIRGGGRVE